MSRRRGWRGPSVAEVQIELLQRQPAEARPGAAYAELGPALAPRAVVYARAREVAACAQRAMEAAIAGPRCDLALAERQFARIRAILGGRNGDGGRE